MWIGCWDDRRIAFPQNSSRGRRQEEALTSFNSARQTVDQPCRARPSPADPAARVGWGPVACSSQSTRPTPTSNLQPSAGKRPTERGTLRVGACAIPVQRDSVAAQTSLWSFGLPGPRFLLSQQGSRRPRRLGSSPAGAPTSDRRCPLAPAYATQSTLGRPAAAAAAAAAPR